MSEDRKLKIGELAARAGVSRHTIRFYECTGVLPVPERTASGYRTYDPEDVERIAFVKKAQALGLKLADIQDVLEISEGGRAPCDHVRRLIEDRLRQAEAKLRELEALRDTLRKTIRRLAEADQNPHGCRCAVIEESGVRNAAD